MPKVIIPPRIPAETETQPERRGIPQARERKKEDTRTRKEEGRQAVGFVFRPEVVTTFPSGKNFLQFIRVHPAEHFEVDMQLL